MILSRVYEPNDSEIIYHYCGASAFLDISTTKKMRFSDVFSMNDFMEMHWGYAVWEKAATQLLPELGQEFLDGVDDVIHSCSLNELPVASCYSLDGDVLSQWRAYADDGKGYAICSNFRSVLFESSTTKINKSMK